VYTFCLTFHLAYNDDMLLRKLAGIVLLAGMIVLLAGCAQAVITRPTPRSVATRTPTATAAPPALVVPPTPDNYTPPPTATPTVTPEPIIHIIQSGENLWTIAALYDVEHDLLRDVNGIENERTLQVGQRLLIPVAGWGGPAEPTPTATATPYPAEVENVFFYPSPLGELAVLGEVLNTSGVDLERIAVQVGLFDAADRPLSSQSNLIELDMLAPGGRSPFVVRFAEAPAQIASYQARVVAAAPAYTGTHSRSLSAENTALEQQAGLMIVSGTVYNRGETEALDVIVVVTLYDALGRVVGTRSTLSQPATIAAGSDAAFRIELVPGGPVADFSVQVQGRIQP